MVNISSPDWIDGFEHGLREGLERGRAMAQADADERFAADAAKIRRAANLPQYADLAEARGEHAAAERQRQILAERGIAVQPGQSANPAHPAEAVQNCQVGNAAHPADGGAA